MTTTALLLAAGLGTRLGQGRPKAFVSISGRPMLLFSLEAMKRSGVIDDVIVVAPGSLMPSARELANAVASNLVYDVVEGGASRSESVGLGLAAMPANTDVVVCHDAARPFPSPDLFKRVVAALQDADGVVPVIASPDTVKRIEGSRVLETIPRETIGLAQTPQAFRAHALQSAHNGRPNDTTDDAVLLERAGLPVATVEGELANFKITTSEDLGRAVARVQLRPVALRPGPSGASTSPTP
ncbi:MAG: 2-C-methyl-D-erythritol 4-phosphate cytidylyltransferase [Actinomycetota bacterium]|nr:2-C-methyl-D-erythritol 4-phosphate cytidylyltransferase [Actinomycetota bacterium]